MILRLLTNIPYFNYWKFSELIILFSSTDVDNAEVFVKFMPLAKRALEFIYVIDCLKKKSLGITIFNYPIIFFNSKFNHV